MILTPLNRPRDFAVMRVAGVYQVRGALELDVLDSSGRLFEGAQLLTSGGGPSEISAAPSVGSEVLGVVLGGACYVIGCLNDEPMYQDERALNSAGEYVERAAVGDVLLKAGESRVILSRDDAVYVSPRLRVQGVLEVSSGGEPLLSGAVGELVLSTLDAYHQTLSDLKTAVEALQEVSSRLSSVYSTASAAASASGDLIRAQDLAEQAIKAGELPSTIITPPLRASRDILSSNLKLEG